jgi:hypothetical protein
MKHSAAMNVKVGDLLALNHKKDGVLWEVTKIVFPAFTIQEAGTDYSKSRVDYSYFQRPTKAQLNAYNKRKEKYYASANNTSTT